MAAPSQNSGPTASAQALAIDGLFSRCGAKATCSQGGPMHVQHPDREGRTLCGVRWWFNCDHGEAYCQRCQQILRSIYRRENVRALATAKPLPAAPCSLSCLILDSSRNRSGCRAFQRGKGYPVRSKMKRSCSRRFRQRVQCTLLTQPNSGTPLDAGGTALKLS